MARAEPARQRGPAGVPAAALALALLGGGLAGCSSAQDDYCDTLKADKASLGRLSARATTSADAMGKTATLLDRLRDASPDDIRGDWDRLADAFAGLRDAVAATGVGPRQLEGGRRPPGVSAGQLSAVRQAATELRSTGVQQAGASIEQHAQDVCKVDLRAELGSG